MWVAARDHGFSLATCLALGANALVKEEAVATVVGFKEVNSDGHGRWVAGVAVESTPVGVLNSGAKNKVIGTREAAAQ